MTKPYFSGLLLHPASERICLPQKNHFEYFKVTCKHWQNPLLKKIATPILQAKKESCSAKNPALTAMRSPSWEITRQWLSREWEGWLHNQKKSPQKVCGLGFGKRALEMGPALENKLFSARPAPEWRSAPALSCKVCDHSERQSISWLPVPGIFQQWTFAFWQDRTWLLMLEKEQDLRWLWTVCSKAAPEPDARRCWTLVALATFPVLCNVLVRAQHFPGTHSLTESLYDSWLIAACLESDHGTHRSRRVRCVLLSLPPLVISHPGIK